MTPLQGGPAKIKGGVCYLVVVRFYKLQDSFFARLRWAAKNEIGVSQYFYGELATADGCARTRGAGCPALMRLAHLLEYLEIALSTLNIFLELNIPETFNCNYLFDSFCLGHT